MSQKFRNADGKPIVEEMIRTIQDNKMYLGKIDGLIGDGDHGMNMNKGFTICQKSIEGKSMSFTDALEELGQILFNEIGGSMGPIYGTIFMSMAEEGAPAEDIDAITFERMLNRAIGDLSDIIEAQVGDKTLIDTLVPARDAFQSALENGEDFPCALAALSKAAEDGKNSTKELVARFGRSSRLGERSRGVLDAGATSCNLLLQAMVRAISILLEDRTESQNLVSI